MNRSDDLSLLIPAREDYLSCLHRMLDPKIVEDPTPFQSEVLNWLCRMHQHLGHVGRVARLRALPTASLELSWILTATDAGDPDWIRFLELSDRGPERIAMMRQIPIDPSRDPAAA